MAVATPGEIGCLLIGLSSSYSTQLSSSPLSLASHLGSDVESMVTTAALKRIKQTLHTTSINTIILILNGLLALYNNSTTNASSSSSSSSSAILSAMTEAICKVIHSRLSSTSSSFTTIDNKHSNSHIIPCRALCTILHNLAHLDHRDGRLLSIISNELVQNHLDCMPLNWLVTVLWSYGKLKYRPAELLSHAVAVRFSHININSGGGRGIEELLRQSLSAHEISLLANALATLSYHPTTRTAVGDEVPSSSHKKEEEEEDDDDDVFTTTLETVCREVAHQISPSEMATVFWSLDKISSSKNNSGRIAFYLPLITDNMSYLTPKDLACIVRVLGNTATTAAVPADHVIWTSIADQATSKVEGANIQDILRILTTYQALGLAPEQLLAAVESWANARLQALTPSALSTALVSYARLGGASPRLLSTAAACATEKSKEFDPGQLARSVWAFATLKHHPGNVLLGEMEELLATGLPLFTDKDASNALWALTSLGYHPSSTTKMQELLGGLVYRVRRRAPLTSPQMLTSIGWSLAHWISTSERDDEGNGTSTSKRKNSSGESCSGRSKSDKKVQILLEEVSIAAIEQIAAFQPQGLSLLSWSFAKLGFSSQPFLSEIINYLVDNPEKLHMFEGQHLANLIWGIASVQIIPLSLEGGNTHNDNDSVAKQLQQKQQLQQTQNQQQFLRQFSLEAYHRVAELRPQELFNVVWALAKLRYRSCRRLLEAAAKEATVAHAAFSPQELTGILWAIAKLLPSSASPSSSSSSLGSGSAMGLNRSNGKKKEQEAAVLRLREAGFMLFNAICKDFSTRQQQYSDGHLALLLWSGGQIAAVHTFSTTTKSSSNNSGSVSSTKMADESSSVIEFTSVNIVVDALYNRVGNGKFNDAARLVMTISGLSRLHTYTHYHRSSTMNSEGCTYALEDILMGNREVQQQLRCHEYAEILASLTRLDRHSTVREILHSEVMKKKLTAGNSVIMGVSDAIWILWSMIVSTGGEYIEPIAGIACKKLYRTSPKYEFGKEELAALGDVFLITQQRQHVHSGNGLPTSVLKLRRPIREKSIAAALQNASPSLPSLVKHRGDVQEEPAVHTAEEQQLEEEDDGGDVVVKYINGGWYG
jgi:hypothetical protein